MFENPRRNEINHRTIKLIMGLMSLSLAILTNYFSIEDLTSISEAYHQGGWPRDILVGFLFAVAAFLMAYNGKSFLEALLSKLAALAAIGVAMFPCGCDGHPQIIPYVHGISAAVMFLILAAFCLYFLGRARQKGHLSAQIRVVIYALCFIVIVAAVGVIAIDYLAGHPISKNIPRLVFFGEMAALLAFGVAWLVAARIIPVLASKDERKHLFD
ncbi:MAG: hypothetical protein AAF358_08925 [Pseudomonadota bacterium]